MDCTMSMMFSCFSTFHYTWCSALQFAVGKELFSHRCWWTWANAHQSGICHRVYCCWFASPAAVMLTVAKPVHKMCISVLFMVNWHVCRYFFLDTSHSTALCAISLTTGILISTCPHLCAHPCTSATTKPITIVNWIHVCDIPDSEFPLVFDYTVLTTSPRTFCISIHKLTMF